MQPVLQRQPPDLGPVKKSSPAATHLSVNPSLCLRATEPGAHAEPVGGDDTALLRRSQHGDQDALRELYERHHRAVFAYLLSLAGARAEAEEVLQDTFVAAWRNAATFQSRSTVVTWLMGIARRQLRDRRRRRSLPIISLDELDGQPAADAPDRTVIARAELAEIARLIRELRPLHREVLHLAFVEQLSYDEMAAVLGVSPGTVASRLNNARSALTRLLAHESGEVPGEG
jgi:RNA polymerase sigma-70 factor (ECF subfamily)